MRSCGRLEYGAMAIFHLQVNTVSRSAGRSATAAGAYRAGERIVDEQTGEIHDYTRKGGVEASALFAPADAPEWAADRARLWNAAEAAERRKNSTVAREFVVALPAELSAEDRQALAFDLGRALVARHGVAVDVCIHAPGKDGDERNHHAHILMTTRRMTPEGLGEKTRELDTKTSGEVEHWRAEWAAMANRALERAGRSERIDHRTLEAQGIERLPTTHNGPAVTDMLRKGAQSDVADRQAAEQAEAAQARAEAQAAARDLAKVQAMLDQVQEAAATEQAMERLRQAEDDRLRKLPAEHLAVEVERLRQRMRSPEDLAKQDPEYRTAKERANELARKHNAADDQRRKAEKQAQAWREAKGIRAWLHDHGVIQSKELAAIEAQAQQGREVAQALRPQAEQAAQQRDSALSLARIRANHELQPERERLEEFKRLLIQKRDAEKAERQKLEAQARAERQQQGDRDQDAENFRAVVGWRAQRVEGMRDGDPEWAAMPAPVRKMVDTYNDRFTSKQQAQLLAELRSKTRPDGATQLAKAVRQWGKAVGLERQEQVREIERGRDYSR